MDVQVRSSLARPVEELRHGELVGVDEQGRAAGLRAAAHRLPVHSTDAADGDEAGIARCVLGRRSLVERVAYRAPLVLVPAA